MALLRFEHLCCTHWRGVSLKKDKLEQGPFQRRNLPFKTRVTMISERINEDIFGEETRRDKHRRRAEKGKGAH